MDKDKDKYHKMSNSNGFMEIKDFVYHLRLCFQWVRDMLHFYFWDTLLGRCMPPLTSLAYLCSALMTPGLVNYWGQSHRASFYIYEPITLISLISHLRSQSQTFV
jgi:hypothetical protein